MNETTQNNPGNTKANALILIAALLIFGLVLGGFGYFRYKVGRDSANWPAVTGKITYSRASYSKGEHGGQYLPSVRYTYLVNGKSYTGTRITSSDMYQKTLSLANDILRDYPVGGEVYVFYNPSDPATSLLEIGIRKNVYILLGAAFFCFFVAIAIGISAIKKGLKDTD